MMAEIFPAGYFYPFSVEFRQASRDFTHLNTDQKITALVLSIIGGIATCFLGGIAAYAVFCSIVDLFNGHTIKRYSKHSKGEPDDLKQAKVTDCVASDVWKDHKIYEELPWERDTSDSEEGFRGPLRKFEEEDEELHNKISLSPVEYYKHSPPIPIPGSTSKHLIFRKPIVLECSSESSFELPPGEELIFPFSDFEEDFSEGASVEIEALERKSCNLSGN